MRMPAVSLGKWSREENNFLPKWRRRDAPSCHTVDTFMVMAGLYFRLRPHNSILILDFE